MEARTLCGFQFSIVRDVDQTKCHKCGKDLGEDQRRAVEQANATHNYLADVPCYCNFCHMRIMHDLKMGNLGLDTESLISDAVADGSIPAEAELIRFGGRPDIETANPDAWREGKTGTSNLWLCGNKGVGKTHLAYAVLNQAIADGQRAAIVRAVEIARFGFNDKQAINKYIHTAYLAIDDIDKDPWSKYGIEQLWSLIDGWCRAGGKRLIITANSTAKQWNASLNADDKTATHAQYAATIMDRIMHLGRGGCRGFEMQGKSWRKSA